MDDSKIIELYMERSEQAISETSKKYGRYCHYIAYSILHNDEDSEECVNDTYLRAWNSIPPKRPSKLQTFLGKITRNLSLNKWEKLSAEKRGAGQTSLILDELSECIPAEQDAVNTVENMLNNGFDDEYIASVLENADGSYAVISRGDLKYFCLSQYTVDGKETYFHKTEVGNYGIWNAARFEDGYMVQLGSYMTNEHAKIVKVDREGNITESFSYGDEDSYYYITDMIEYNGNIYLSAYAVPRLANEDQSAGGRYEIAGVLNYLFDNNIWEISCDELTPMVRDNYTAMLLVCEPNAGKPQEYYSVNGSLGGKLSVSDTGNLLWDVESITSTFFSPATSSFTIGGTSYVFRYTFDTSGMLISQEKTGEVVNYRR